MRRPPQPQQPQQPPPAGLGAHSWYNTLRYHVVPPLFVLLFPCITLWLSVYGQGAAAELTAAAVLHRALGSRFAWTVMLVYLAWALLWLKLPGPVTSGPVTAFGYTPTYANNGVLYYWASLAAFCALQALWPDLSTRLWQQTPELLGALNITALLFCVFLLLKGKLRPEHPADRLPPRPLLYEYYRGMELHPHLLGVDVKQFTNCRVGVMGWQLLVLAYYLAGVREHGNSYGTMANLLLQSIYIAKFFWWEGGYFHTLDITLDRAGYYLCWGCLVWVPCFYTYSSYYLVAQPPLLSDAGAAGSGALGMACVMLNYRVDYERQAFRAAPRDQCSLWGRPCTYLAVKYRDAEGCERESLLLTSGFWGVARHLNYTFEILAALAWSLPGLGHGLPPFLYVIFLTGLLVHRVFRDEEKCAAKYGRGWEDYCSQVPWRMLPCVF